MHGMRYRWKSGSRTTTMKHNEVLCYVLHTTVPCRPHWARNYNLMIKGFDKQYPQSPETIPSIFLRLQFLIISIGCKGHSVYTWLPFCMHMALYAFCTYQNPRFFRVQVSVYHTLAYSHKNGIPTYWRSHGKHDFLSWLVLPKFDHLKTVSVCFY